MAVKHFEKKFRLSFKSSGEEVVKVGEKGREEKNARLKWMCALCSSAQLLNISVAGELEFIPHPHHEYMEALAADN